MATKSFMVWLFFRALRSAMAVDGSSVQACLTNISSKLFLIANKDSN